MQGPSAGTQPAFISIPHILWQHKSSPATLRTDVLYRCDTASGTVRAIVAVTRCGSRLTHCCCRCGRQLCTGGGGPCLGINSNNGAVHSYRAPSTTSILREGSSFDSGGHGPQYRRRRVRPLGLGVGSDSPSPPRGAPHSPDDEMRHQQKTTARRVDGNRKRNIASGDSGGGGQGTRQRKGNTTSVVASQKDYMRRIKEVGLRNRWQEVRSLLDEMRTAEVPRNVFVYNAAISALARCRRPADAELLLDEMLDTENLAPDLISYNSAINAHARLGDLASARRLLELMRSRFVKPDVVTFNTLADAAAKKGDPVAAAEILSVMAEEGVTPDMITYNACLAACSRKGDLPRAITLLDLMMEDGLEPDQRSYSAVISAAGRSRQWEEVPKILEEMRHAGLRPDRVTFNTAISALGMGDQWRAATSLLGGMKAAGVPPDAVSFTAALVACGHAGEWELSLRLLEEMQAAGVSPNAHSYSAAMDACGKAGQQEQALRLLSEMKHRGGISAPDTIAYNSAIDACSVTGDWLTALRLLDEMKEGTGGAAAAPPDVVSYGGAITACARAGRVEEALRLVAELRANEARVTDAAVRGKTATRDKLYVRGKPTSSRAITGGMNNVGGRGAGELRNDGGAYALPLPNLVTYSAALFACLKAGEVHRGTELLGEMIASGIKPNDIHCDTMVAAWSAAGEPDRALSIMKRLQMHGFEPSLGTFEALVWGFAQVADWESAVRLLASILDRGLKPSTRSWDAAIAACSQAGHWERALALLADMRRQGVFPSRVTYTAAVAGLNRPRYAEWGPKLERLAMLLQQRTDTSWENRRYRRNERRREDREGRNGGFAGDTSGRSDWRNETRGREGEPAGLDDSKRSDPPNSLRNALNSGPSPEDFDGSIEALGDAGHANGAACLLRVMRREGFHASPRAYRSVIYACARIGLLSEAVALAKEMEAEGDCPRRRRRRNRSPPSVLNSMSATEQATDLSDRPAAGIDRASGEMMGKTQTEGASVGIVGTGNRVDQTRALVGDFALVGFGVQGGTDDAAALSSEEAGEGRREPLSSRKVEVDAQVDGDQTGKGSASSTTTTATSLSGHEAKVEAEDDEDYDLGVVYNCIVCNFARAAASGAFDEVGAGVWGSSGSSGESPPAVGRGGGKGDESGLVSLLMDVTERAEEVLDNEAASGGVVVSERLELTSAALAEAGGLGQLSSASSS